MTNLITGGVTRRGLMQGAAAGALLLSASGLPAQAAPTRGGTMRMGKAHGQTSDSLDPGSWENGFTTSVGFGVYNRLTEVDADGNAIPELAESWEASADASEWTFKLRKAQFHDGKPVTAADVIASINHHRGEDSKSAAKPIVAAVKDMVANGDTVTFKLEGGNADFPFVLTDYHLVIGADSGDGTVDWSKANGSGSYKLTNWEPGVRADFARNDNNWRTDRGWFETVEMIALVDPVARMNAMMTGQVDAIDRIDPKSVALFDANPNVTVEAVEGTLHYTFPMRVNEAPFDDNNVRMALKLGIRREEMVEKILNGYGSVGNDLPISRAQRFFNHDIPQRQYDPEKAKWHLKQSGLDSVDVTLYSSEAAYAGAVNAAQLFAASAKDAGVNIQVERAANDGYWSNIWNNKAFCSCYWGGRPIEDLMFSTAYQGGQPWNDTAWANARFDELLIKARSELNADLRREMYYEMQVILHNEGGLIAPMFANMVHAISSKVKHEEKIASNWSLDGERWMERWWFG